MNQSPILVEAKKTLIELLDTIQLLNYDEYNLKIERLSNATIGEHTRHIIELFQLLQLGYEKNCIDYDQRDRNVLIQENIDYASECIAELISKLNQPNKNLQLKSLYNKTNLIETNYYREIIYNIEHCIHHQAIIKIGLKCMGIQHKNENFGVAKSTILYNKSCVQ